MSQAVSELISAKLRSNGQVCIAPNRILVHENIAEDFCDKLCKSISNVIIGDPANSNCDIGPLINSNAAAKANAHLNDAINKGANIIAQASPLDETPLADTFFVPTVIDNVNSSMRLMHEETFAPLFAISTFANEEDAITVSNDSDVGLAAYIYTRDVQRLFRVAEALQVGMVGANSSASK